MKKTVVLLPLFLLPLLTSCQKVSATLTYGTYLQSEIYSLNELSNEELLVKTRDQEETFLLAVYQGDYSRGCLCWETFKNVIVSYINNYHETVYVYNSYNQDDSLANLKIEKVEESTPYLYIFKGKETLAKYNYANKKNKAIFEDTTAKAMNTQVHKVVKKPSMYYVNETYLDSEELKKKDHAVLYIRNGCGDCKYVLPNVIIPYINNHSLAKDIYIYDMQNLYDLSKKEDASELEKNKYQETKDKYGLSTKGNSTFGYQNGVVPTIQYVKDGKVSDCAIYFNDVLSKKEDGSYYLSDSFYSEERLSHLNYLKGCKFPTNLKGMTIEEGVLQSENGHYYWAQNAANLYYKPILEAFLEYYLS